MPISEIKRVPVEINENGDRIRSGEPDDIGDVWAYPGPNCRGGARCVSCPTFFCTRCRQWRPWCVGMADEHHPTWCSDCWFVAHRWRKRKRACRCGEVITERKRRRAAKQKGKRQ